jgi:SAM-dependent methyltransferase
VSSSPTAILPFASGPESAGQLVDRFRAEVAARQLREWLPEVPSTILDLSPGCPGLVGEMVDRGHRVVHAQHRPLPPRIERAAADGRGALVAVAADPRTLDWVADGSVDAVVAEGGLLSTALAAEFTVRELFRALRPGGRFLACADSLLGGLARLAEQGRWAELADVPAADVVLVPDGADGDDARVRRCFWPQELEALLTDAGFAVDWIRPRTVLAEETVARALALDPGRLDALVTTELRLAERRQGESIGNALVASARRPC